MRNIQQYDGMLALDNAHDHMGIFADMVKQIKDKPELAETLNVPNVLLNGLHGTGKTSSIKAMCAERGLNLCILTGSTLDVFVHILGIPVVQGEENKNLEFIRSSDLGIDEADVIFIDESNRAARETRNALFEILLNRSINGVPLPNLKWCLTAINPVDLYTDTYELDQAMLDRFPIKLTTPPTLTQNILQTCGVAEDVAECFSRWWNGGGAEDLFAAGPDMIDRMKEIADPAEAMLSYISPRTMTEAAIAYTHTRSFDTVKLFFATNEQRELMRADYLMNLLEEADVETENTLGGDINIEKVIADFAEIMDTPSRLQEFTATLTQNHDNITLMNEIGNSLVRSFKVHGELKGTENYVLNQLPDEVKESVQARINGVEFED